MLKLLSRMLALVVTTVVAGAVFVTLVALWSWWAPTGSVASDAPSPAVRTPPPR